MNCRRGFPTKWRSTFPLGLLLLITLAIAFAACSGDGQASLEERALSIDQSLICPVCPGETIDQSQVPIAYQMKAIVRERLADGWTREQVLQFFVDRYGESVLAAPPKSGFNLIAWLVPLAAVVGALTLLLFVIRSMKKGPTTWEGSETLSEPELEPYLSLVDRELGIDRRSLQDPEEREVSGTQE